MVNGLGEQGFYLRAGKTRSEKTLDYKNLFLYIFPLRRFRINQTFLPISPMMIMTRLTPMTAPAVVPTVCINATASVDFDAMDSMKK